MLCTSRNTCNYLHVVNKEANMLVWVIVFFDEAQIFEAINNSISAVSLAWLLNDNILKDCHVVPRVEIRLHYTHCSQFAFRGVIRKCMGCLKKYIEPSPIWYFFKDLHVFLYYPSKCLHNIYPAVYFNSISL